MALRELIAIFGVEVDSKQLDSFEKKIGSTIGSLKDLGSTLLGGFAVGAFASFVEGQIAAVAQLDDTAQRLGVTTDALQEFQFVAGQSGVSAEGAANSLKFLNKNLGDALSGGASAQVFSGLKIGLDGVKDGSQGAIDLLPELAEKFASMGTDAERTQAAMQIFGKSGTDLLPLLKGGAAGVKQLQEQFQELGGALDASTIKSMAEADDQIAATKGQFANLSRELVSALLPILRSMLAGAQKVVSFFRTLNRDTNILKTGMLGLSAVLGVMAGARLIKLAPMIWNAIKAVRAMTVSLFGMNIPLLLIAAVFLLVFLALDDLYALMTGGDSVIGQWLDQFGGVGTAAELAKTLKGAWDEINKSFEESGPAFEPILKILKEAAIDALPMLISAFVTVTKVIAAAATLLGAFIASLIALPDAIKTGDFSQIGKTIDAAGNAVFGKSVSSVDAKTGNVSTNNVGGLFGDAPSLPKSGQLGFIGPPPKVDQHNPVTINVSGTGDPAQVAKKVGDNVGKIQQDANQAALGAIRSGV